MIRIFVLLILLSGCKGVSKPETNYAVIKVTLTGGCYSDTIKIFYAPPLDLDREILEDANGSYKAYNVVRYSILDSTNKTK